MTNYRVFDGHCDTPIELWLQNQPLLENTLAVSLARAQRLGTWAQFFAFCTAWVEAKLPRPEIFARALDYFDAQLRENADKITLCRTASEAEAAMQSGKCAAFLAIEGAEAVREDEGLLERAYEMGVSDYISRPFDAKIVYQRVLNTIKLYAKQRRLINLITDQVYEKEKNNKMMIGILSQIVEFRNSKSGMHVRNISTLTGMLLEKIVQKTDKYYLSWSKRFYITNGSVLHDIGKIGIPEELLNKPGKLTKEEYEIMKEHTVIGEKMLKNLELYQDEPLVKTACEIVRWHHERYDGKGYPDGLKGDEIPISAQIVSIADVYDELVSERVYKKAFSHEKAMEMILNGEYGAFNPLLLECLVEIQDRIKTELDGSGSVKKETYKKTIQEIERDMNMNTL